MRTRYECTFILYFFLLSCSQLFPNLNPFIERDVLGRSQTRQSYNQKTNTVIFVHMHALLIHFISVSSINS